jgi:hypothetical protein
MLVKMQVNLFLILNDSNSGRYNASKIKNTSKGILVALSLVVGSRYMQVIDYLR